LKYRRISLFYKGPKINHLSRVDSFESGFKKLLFTTTGNPLMLIRRATVVTLVLFSLGLATAEAVAISFEGLGDLPGGVFDSVPTGVSNGGAVVVGASESALALEAFRWTSAGGMVALHRVDPAGRTYAHDVSADGKVVVGTQTVSGSTVAAVWNADGSYSTRGYPSFLTWSATSADGSVIAGTAGSIARYLGPVSFVTILGSLPGGSSSSNAYGVSGDGSVIVGLASSSGGNQAFRWNAGEGMVGLGDLPGGSFSSGAFSASEDGSVIVGRSNSATGNTAFRWTAGQGMLPLGSLPPGAISSVAYDVSGDGLRVVGLLSIDGVGNRAMLWDATAGMRRLDDVLVEAGVDLTGWTLATASAISSDGLAIVGVGSNPAGEVEGWLVILPTAAAVPALAPLSVWALALVLGLFGARGVVRRATR
jgi:probable HAF family extracellular repeat protein